MRLLVAAQSGAGFESAQVRAAIGVSHRWPGTPQQLPVSVFDRATHLSKDIPPQPRPWAAPGAT